MGQKISADIGELIALIGEHLYDEPDVVVREIIQNSYDSILERHGKRITKAGLIRVVTASSPASLEFIDNGVGMDRDDLDKYLSVIGQGLKKLKKAGSNKMKPIGEFGIGFYSAFMISEKIIVETRKKKDSPALIWTSQGHGEYNITEDPQSAIAPGTKVTLHLQLGSSHYADDGEIRKVILKYCNYLDCPIHLNDHRTPINVMKFPWELRGRQAQRRWIDSHFETSECFKVGSGSRGTVNFNYVLSFSPDGKREHQIYCRRMFVTDRLMFVENYVDFIDVMIECDTLPLNVSREHVQKNRTMSLIERALHDITLKWIKRLLGSQDSKEELTIAIREHQSNFRALAIKDPVLFERIYPCLLFKLANSEKEITISEYIDLATKIRPMVLYCYRSANSPVTSGDNDALLLVACKKSNIPILVVQSEQDRELLRKICNKLDCDLADYRKKTQLFIESSSGIGSALSIVQRNCEIFLAKKTRLARYSPSELPMLIDGDEIVLNEDCRFLVKLGDTKVRQEKLRTVYHSLYRIFQKLNTLEISRTRLDSVIREIGDAFAKWTSELTESENAKQNLSVLADRWWTGPAPITNIEGERHCFTHHDVEYSRRCFIACSFDESYRDVVHAVKKVCESNRILAETAEKPGNRNLFEKICRMIDLCDFAIVDISEVNPNVMLELGLLIARRKPCVILRNKKMKLLAGIDVPVDIIQIERIEYLNTTDDLTKKLVSVFSELRL
ncbi:ATP-binding protein [Planctomycetota bacterium]